MGIQHLNYKVLSPDRRSVAGTTALNELKRIRGMPGLSAAQREEIQARIQKIRAWIDGTLEVPQQDHKVVVAENLQVVDKA
jgi:hypothetical protein